MCFLFTDPTIDTINMFTSVLFVTVNVKITFFIARLILKFMRFIETLKYVRVLFFFFKIVDMAIFKSVFSRNITFLMASTLKWSLTKNVRFEKI